jgi:hypothetical protein
MITKEDLIENGYSVLKKGAWLRLDPMIIPHDWEDTCKDFGIDPNCDEIIVAIAGVKEVYKENE